MASPPSCFAAAGARAFVSATLLEGHLDAGLPFHPFRHRQLLVAQEVRVEQARLVACAVVAQYGHDPLARTQLASQPDSAGDVHAAGGADANSFLLDQSEDDAQRLVVGDAEGEI